jgi:hypothetical protein
MADRRKAFDVERAHRIDPGALQPPFPSHTPLQLSTSGEFSPTLAQVPAAPVQAEQVPQEDDAQQWLSTQVPAEQSAVVLQLSPRCFCPEPEPESTTTSGPASGEIERSIGASI